MPLDAQLLKGVLESCVLGIIARGETYGYEILTTLEETGLGSIGEGSLYPILTRMDKNGWISCRRAKSPLGPIRKYYQITEQGQEKLRSFQKDFEQIAASVSQILQNKEKKS
ncbi:PadR family transcriptional regulator [Streptococcus cameli]